MGIATISALIGIAMIIAFFYLVNIVSHIRNILRIRMYHDVSANIERYGEKNIKALKKQGALDAWQEKDLLKQLGK